MKAILQDIRYALRTFRLHPSFALLTTLALGLGICAVTASFSFLDALVLRPFSYGDPERIVRLWGENVQDGLEQVNMSPVDLFDIQERSRTLDGVTIFAESTHTLTGLEEPQQVRAGICSVEFFSVLGVKPALGRDFLPGEGVRGHHQVAILSNDFWQRQFGSDRGIVGRTVKLDDKIYTIIGVAPAQFEHPSPSMAGEPDLWRPLALDPAEMERGEHWAKAVARLSPGAGMEEARAELKTLARQLEQAYPQSNTGWSLDAEPLSEAMTDEVRPALLILFGAVLMLLLITCFNVANLLLARGLAQQRELAVRAALGAERSRLIRQLLVESTILSILGGAAGLLLTPAAIRLLAALSPPGVPRLEAVGIDGRVLGFALLISLVSGLISGVIPALRVSRVDFHSFLKEGSRGSASHSRLRSTLVVVQVALSVVLLVTGALWVESFMRLMSVDPGFASEGVLTVQVSLPQSYSDPARVTSFFDMALSEIAQQQGVAAAGAVNMLPFTTRSSCNNFLIEGRPIPQPSDQPCAEYRSTARDYFRAMGINLVRGRVLSEKDRADSELVAVINQTMARRFWPGQDPIGKRVRWGDADELEGTWYKVVGVVADVKHSGLTADSMPEIYVPQAQDDPPPARMMLVVRNDSTEDAISAVRRVIGSLDGSLPLYDVDSMEGRISKSVWLERLGAVTISTFSTMSLLLAILGLYGIISYLVNQRRHEFGIRMALGAQRNQLLRLVVGQGLRLTLLGLVFGLVGSILVSRWMASRVSGLDASDPATFIAVATLLTTVALLACCIPARRAGSIDPATGLRKE